MEHGSIPEFDDAAGMPLADAEKFVQAALDQAQAQHGAESLQVAGRLVQLARVLMALGEGGEWRATARARPALKRALAIAESVYGARDVRLLGLLELLAVQVMRTSQGPEAEALRRRALAIAEATYGADQPEVAVVVGLLAGQWPYSPKHAEPLRRRALKIDEAALGPNHPRVAEDLAALASSLQEWDTSHDLGAGEQVHVGGGVFEVRPPKRPPDRSAEVEALRRRALAVAEVAHGVDDPAVAVRLRELANVVAARGRSEEAEALRQRAAAIGGRGG